MGRVHWLAVYLYYYLSAVVAINNQCYNRYCFIKPDPVNSNDVQETFPDAQQWCHNNSAVLLEIPDEHVQAAVQSYYTDNAFTLVTFLNAQLQQTDWTWTDGTPYNSGWGEKCPAGISLTDELCIVVNSSLSSWFEARLSCFQSGGNLASLQDIHVSSLVNKLPLGTGYWIGLTNRQWIWQDLGTQMVYNNWQPGKPGSAICLCLFSGAGSWTDCECRANTRPFICLQNVALALGVGIGGGVGLIIIIILVVVAAVLCTRRRRERSPDKTHPIKGNDPSSVYAQVIPSKDPRLPSASVESSPRIGKELIYVDLAPSDEAPSNSARRQTMRPPDILPESFKQKPNVIVVNNGDIYSVPQKISSTSQG